jgi:tagaturonate epimerase
MEKKGLINQFSDIFKNQYQIYPNSLKEKDGSFFVLAKNHQKKFLVVNGLPEKLKKLNFKADEEKSVVDNKHHLFRYCPLTNHNLNQLRSVLDYLKPSCSKIQASFGTGDRLGIATPAHIQAFENKNIFPILAQQSV